MILSSANILEILQGSAVIRMAAGEIRIVNKKPVPSGREGFFVYIEKYPTVEEFEATWRVWIESDGSEPDDLLLAEMRRLLPSFEFKLGLIIEATVRDFKSDNTELRPKPLEAPVVMPPTGWMDGIEKRFEELAEDIQDRMLLVGSGRPGKDGARGPEGRPGASGRDGKDIDATNTELFDLKDADQSVLPMEKGQVLTWDGSKWTNLYVRQTSAVSGGGGSTGSGAGVSATIAWTYHPHDHTTEPNSGHFHTDSADGELVTVFHVSNDTSRGNDVEILLRDLLQQGYDRIYVALADDLSQAHLYAITGYTETAGGFELTVTHVETAGAEPDYQNAKGYEFLFTKSAVAGGGGIPEAPIDGNYYVRRNGAWVELSVAMAAVNP